MNVYNSASDQISVATHLEKISSIARALQLQLVLFDVVINNLVNNSFDVNTNNHYWLRVLAWSDNLTT